MFRELMTLWRHPSVPRYKKNLLALISLGYWLFPIDFIPILPFDDILVALAAAAWFIYSSHKDLDGGKSKKTIDTDAEILD